MCDLDLYAPLILFPSVLLGSSLNPMAAPFPSESLLDQTADSFHPHPFASIDMPPLRPVPTSPASPSVPLVAPSPEYQHDKFNSSVPAQHKELSPPGIQHNELDDLIQASVNQFLSSDGSNLMDQHVILKAIGPMIVMPNCYSTTRRQGSLLSQCRRAFLGTRGRGTQPLLVAVTNLLWNIFISCKPNSLT